MDKKKNCTSWIDIVSVSVFFFYTETERWFASVIKMLVHDSFLFKKKNADWSIIVIFIVVIIIVIFTLHAIEGINLAVGLAGGLSSVLLRTK